MNDTAREAGGSPMTVSRIINNKEDVSSATRLWVLEIIDRLGYRPSKFARGLVTQRTGTLGVAVPDIANPFFSGVVRGAEPAGSCYNLSLWCAPARPEPGNLVGRPPVTPGRS
jgi:DNA-binding LacI/PurR family transcriptional regulator